MAFISNDHCIQYGIYRGQWDRGLTKELGPKIQVIRATQIDRGKKNGGVCRVLSIHTERDDLDIYVTQSGRTRVFRRGKGELKENA